MRARLRIPLALTLMLFAAGGRLGASPNGPESNASSDAPPASQNTQTPAQRGLAFLIADAAKWRTERKCATCHHGTLTVWALSEARSHGYKVDNAVFNDTTKWTKERLENIDKPRDTRPGFSMVNTPALYLAMMALAVPKQDAVSTDELNRIAGHLLRHQEANGSWAWSSAPAKNRPPPVFESDEVATLLAYIDLGPQDRVEPAGESPAKEARARAAAWLKQQKVGESTQARALQLFLEMQRSAAPADLKANIDRLLALQHEDGGWGQERGLPSDAYATGQALYFLSLAGISRDRDEIKRGVNFLTATQKDDGSWPMTSRSHPGATPMTNPVPITYFGSAWATLGLIRALPPPPKS